MDKPLKAKLNKIPFAICDYDLVVRLLLEDSCSKTTSLTTPLAVHGFSLALRDIHFRKTLQQFDYILPDGQPLRHSLNLLYNLNLKDRVYGPFLMQALCKSFSENNLRVYLYGSYKSVVESLKLELIKQYPNLQIVGAEPSTFKDISENELQELSLRIKESKADLVFIGIGCPRQEQLSLRLKTFVNCPLVCVGAAFDFLSLNKKMAPSWMQKNSLEWLFRVTHEPKRLWKRYLFGNSIFIVWLALAWLRKIIFKNPV